MATTVLKERLKSSGIFLIDFHVFDVPLRLQASRGSLFQSAATNTTFTQEEFELMGRCVYSSKSGVGDIAGVAPGFKKSPWLLTYDAAIEEWEMIAFDVVGKLLKKLGIDAKEIDVVVTTNSTLNSIPSLSARICNRFNMRKDVQNFSLGGQGCAGGIAAIDLAKHLLRSMPEKRALVVLNENLTAAWYDGHYKPFLISNMLFRLGGAALLMSNKKSDKRVAKYTLQHVVRSIDTSDDSQECIKLKSDPGDPMKQGVQINGSFVVECASGCLKDVLTRLAPLVLPVSELAKIMKNPKHKPNFSIAFQHVVIHPGALVVIEGVRKALGFGDKAAIPSLETLNRFANTSSSSTLYILANVESRIGVKKGDKILQLAMGSGFKAAAAVWKARRSISEVHPAWEGNPQLFIPPEEDEYAWKYTRPAAAEAKDLADMDLREEKSS